MSEAGASAGAEADVMADVASLETLLDLMARHDVEELEVGGGVVRIRRRAGARGVPMPAAASPAVAGDGAPAVPERRPRRATEEQFHEAVDQSPDFLAFERGAGPLGGRGGAWGT